MRLIEISWVIFCVSPVTAQMCHDIHTNTRAQAPSRENYTGRKKGFKELKLYYPSQKVPLETRPFLRGDLWMFNHGFAVKSPLQYWRSENYYYTLEEFYFLLMPVLRQLIASAEM